MEYTERFEFGRPVSVADFRKNCKNGMFTDKNGYGFPAKNGMMNNLLIKPSSLDKIPEDATHIIWMRK